MDQEGYRPCGIFGVQDTGVSNDVHGICADDEAERSGNEPDHAVQGIGGARVCGYGDIPFPAGASVTGGFHTSGAGDTRDSME